jgi:hypothetical protein
MAACAARTDDEQREFLHGRQVGRIVLGSGVTGPKDNQSLMATVPEAFADPGDREYYLGDEPLAYPALGNARMWIENHALELSGMARLHADVKTGHADVVTRFWDFVESQARDARQDTALRTLLQVECFEGVGWVEDLVEYLGPETRALLVDAQTWLSRFNGQIGRWTPARSKRERRR